MMASFTLALSLVLSNLVGAEDKLLVPAALPAVRVQLPEGDLRMSYVEASSGMELLIHAGDAHVQSRRLYLGDGKIAVAYEATGNGVWSQGKQLPNQAAFDFTHKTVVEVSREHAKPWGQQAGEIYVRMQGVEFKVVETK
jgi:hypothetical protein